MVSIAAFQAVDPGSIPGRRSSLFVFFFFLTDFPEQDEAFLNLTPHSLLACKSVSSRLFLGFSADSGFSSNEILI